MKIAIDCRLISTNRGMGRYIREILNQLNQLDKKNEYILFSNEKINLKLNNNFKIKRISIVNYFVYEQIILPYLCKRNKVDILWCGGNTFPLFLSKKIKLFVTIHDLIFFKELSKHETFYQKLGRFYRKLNLLIGINLIFRCFTVSEYSKKEIEDKFFLKNITITYNNIDNFMELLEESNETKILKKLNLKKNEYFYTVSGTSPNKNLEMLLKVFKNSIIKKKIVITGVKDYKKSRFYRYILDNNLKNKIIFTEIINDYEMIDLYKNSIGFIFISLMEGFGIPLIEAQACNCNIICSNRTSIPEVAGKNSILVNPEDYKMILENVYKLSKNEEKISKKSEELNKFISWKKTAQLILDEFETRDRNE